MQLDQLMEFFSLHSRTCGEGAVDVGTEGSTLHQVCRCGAVVDHALSVEDCETLLGAIQDDSAFAKAVRTSARRVVQ